jgi:hypothetical protein
LAASQAIAFCIEGTLILTVLETTPLFVLIVTFRLTTTTVGTPKVTSSPKVPRARMVPTKPVPGVAKAAWGEKILWAP